MWTANKTVQSYNCFLINNIQKLFIIAHMIVNSVNWKYIMFNLKDTF